MGTGDLPWGGRKDLLAPWRGGGSRRRRSCGSRRQRSCARRRWGRWRRDGWRRRRHRFDPHPARRLRVRGEAGQLNPPPLRRVNHRRRLSATAGGTRIDLRQSARINGQEGSNLRGGGSNLPVSRSAAGPRLRRRPSERRLCGRSNWRLHPVEVFRVAVDDDQRPRWSPPNRRGRRRRRRRRRCVHGWERLMGRERRH
jgi:hypothetical protein